MRVESNLSRRRARRPAFTLMEVLVVVAILVVLASVGGVIYIRIQEDAERQLAGVRAKEIETAVKSYMRAHGDIPPATLDELVQPSDGGRGYLDPNMLLDPWGQPYLYNPEPQPGSPNALRGAPDIISAGPNRVHGDADDIGNWIQ